MLITEIPRIVSGKIAGRTEPVPPIWRIFAAWHMAVAPLGYMTVGALGICLLWEGLARDVLHLPLPAIPPLPKMNRMHLSLVLGGLAILGFRQAVVDLRDLLQNGSGYVPIGLQSRVLRINIGYSSSGNLFRIAGYLCYALILALVCFSNPLKPDLLLFISLEVPMAVAAVVAEIYLPTKIIRELRLELWPQISPRMY